MSGSRFRRLVLELGHGAADAATMREVAALARLLDAELHALFVEDEALLHASSYPFAREISRLSHRWRPLEPGRLEVDLRAAADRARLLVGEAARDAGVRRNFEVRRGDLAVQIEAVCVASDIVVVSPSAGAPDSPRRLAASVLFLPRVRGRAHGPIVAVTSGDDDPALVVARRIAVHGHERLVEVEGGTLGEAPEHGIAAALDDIKERLIVIARDAPFGEAGAGLSVSRGVPVLVVEGPMGR